MSLQTEISYSVAIRTLGTAGDKYEKLMNSVAALVPKPKEVVVVLPEGYEEPEYQIGCELFVRSQKGMIVQRLEALKYITAENILFCDDDVEFECDFVQKLYEPIRNGYSCSAGPLLEFFPPAGIKYLIASLMGGACVMLHSRDKMYTRILNTGGWSYNRNVKTDEHHILVAESLAWTCFFIKTKVMKLIQFENETWIERNGYAAFDDRVFFYKLCINGYKSCIVSDAVYIHNDAMTSTKSLKREPIYARAFNHYVFWHRFLYNTEKHLVLKLWKRICIEYYILMVKLAGKIKRVPKTTYNATIKGFKEAKEFVKSEDYACLEDVWL
ncbi:glycosyltransferase [Ruminococcus sp. MCC718]|uniref:glycosyltransferase n=1 Tax=Ruminococcus sp. MCC718 TaxID=2592649 RepID=UPI001C018E09|nr:glycosyltransferase [Ruminococcus sp. MCC718]MBT9653281.1 glycosyltransferase [Ruminococcus sp. MCC718]